jgi:hypothetical protein
MVKNYQLNEILNGKLRDIKILNFPYIKPIKCFLPLSVQPETKMRAHIKLSDPCNAQSICLLYCVGVCVHASLGNAI